MNEQGPDPKDSPAGVDEEALNRALSTLEDMLGQPAPDGDGAAHDADPDAPRAAAEIPTLNAVFDPHEADAGEAPAPLPTLESLADRLACQKLVDRLASEIEVLVSSGVEAALHNAAKDVTRRVREHVKIMLPEILDEIAAIERHRDEE